MDGGADGSDTDHMRHTEAQDNTVDPATGPPGDDVGEASPRDATTGTGVHSAGTATPTRASPARQPETRAQDRDGRPTMPDVDEDLWQPL